MARDGFFVVDDHHHVGSLMAIGSSTGMEAMSDEEAERVELDARLASMDATGIDQAIVIPGHAYLRPDGLVDTRAVNDGIAAYRDRCPDRLPAAVGIVEPLYGDRGLAELERIAVELNLVGVSIHARFHGVSTNSPYVVEIVRRAADLGLVPWVHAVGEVADEALWRVQALAEAVPDAVMIVVDAFGSFESSQQVAAVARVAPNLVFDVSLSHSTILVERCVDEFGPERWLFGTDLYSNAKPSLHNHGLEQLLESNLDDEAKRAILAGNIQRILELT